MNRYARIDYGGSTHYLMTTLPVLAQEFDARPHLRQRCDEGPELFLALSHQPSAFCLRDGKFEFADDLCIQASAFFIGTLPE